MSRSVSRVGHECHRQCNCVSEKSPQFTNNCRRRSESRVRRYTLHCNRRLMTVSSWQPLRNKHYQPATWEKTRCRWDLLRLAGCRGGDQESVGRRSRELGVVSVNSLAIGLKCDRRVCVDPVTHEAKLTMEWLASVQSQRERKTLRFRFCLFYENSEARPQIFWFLWWVVR